MQRLLEFIAKTLRRLKTLAWTTAVRGRFARFGSGSCIEPFSALYNPACVAVGKRVHIREYAWLNCVPRTDGKPTLSIGDGTYIGRFVHINAFGEIVIEDDVMIADRVYIADTDHNYKDPEVPIIRQGDKVKEPVHLKRGCWVGTGAAILPGVTVGKNAVVGPNTVLHKDLPDYGLAFGNPAKVVTRPDAPAP